MTPPLQTVRCPTCDTIQTVPASSPRGFALRLRCRSCRAMLTDDELTRLTARYEVPAAPVAEGWSVVVEGEVIGPVTEAEIRRYHRASVIDDEALVWHEGFRGWARLSETITFRDLAGGRRPAPRAEDAVVDLTHEIEAAIDAAIEEDEPEAASEPSAGPVITGDTVVAAIASLDESAMLPVAATAGIYPIPRTGARLVPLLVAAAVAVGLATVGGVGLVAMGL